MDRLIFTNGAVGARAVFNRALQSEARIKDGVVTLDTLGSFYEAIDKGIKAEVATGKYKEAKAGEGGEYSAAAKAFFAANDDILAIYIDQVPPVHAKQGGAAC